MQTARSQPVMPKNLPAICGRNISNRKGYANNGISKCYAQKSPCGIILKKHYEVYILEYEHAHDDVDAECCRHCLHGNWP